MVATRSQSHGCPLTAGADYPLSSFADELFIPIKLRGRSDRARGQVREAIDWLERSLHRRPLLSDLSAAALDTLARDMRATGVSLHRQRTVINALRSLSAFAASIGYGAVKKRPVLPIGEPSRLQSLSPPADRTRWTLRQFFDHWFLPAVLHPRRRDSQTAARYRDVLAYWEAITGNPVLAEITDQTCVQFVEQLPDWGAIIAGVPRGSKHPIARRDESAGCRPLSGVTIASHVSRLATLLRCCGPRYDVRRPSAGILTALPYVPLVTTDRYCKGAFGLEEAREVYRAAEGMRAPCLPGWISHRQWWGTKLALYFYTGLRSGTVEALCWRHVEKRAGVMWLKVPAAIVKTRKAIEFPVHPHLECLLELLPQRDPDDLLLPRACGYRHILTLHLVLQTLAGISADRQQSPHGWRRTHSQQMALLGAERGLEVAREALDHADVRTTRDSYVHQSLVNALRLRLPSLAQ